MKQILAVLVMVFALAIGAGAQTTIKVDPPQAGYVEKYDCVDRYISDTLIVGTDTVIWYDTVYVRGYNDYKAISYPGYQFDGWEVITSYYDYNCGLPQVWYDTVFQDNLEIYDTDTIDWEGWLDWDMGMPDLSVVRIPGIIRIQIIAHYIAAEVNNDMAVDFPSQDTSPTNVTINIIGKVQWITVVDDKGNVVASTDRTSISLQGCPSGMYHIQVTDEKGNQVNSLRVVNK